MAIPLSFDKDFQAFLFDVARGAIAGFSYVKKFGHCAAIGTSPETVWSGGGLYPYLTAATKFNISSDSVQDDAAAVGTGAWTIKIQGLGEDYHPLEEVVSLGGQLGVQTVNTYLRIFRGIVLTSGTSDTNVGELYAGTGAIIAGVPANIYLVIEATHGQTLMATYTVPAGKTAYLLRDAAYDSTAKLMTASIFARPFGGSWNIKSHIHFLTSIVERPHLLFNSFEEKTDVELQGVSSAAGGALTGEFDLLLEDNSC